MMIIKLNNHLYMKQYRATKKTKINDLQKEEKLKKTTENKLKEKLRKRIYQEKKKPVYHHLREDQDCHLFKV